MMDRTEFGRLIRIGSGRAQLWAREHDVSEFRDVILHACLHCVAVDPQCEGTRVNYLLDMLEHVPDRQTYLDAVVEAMPGCGDDWDAVHRFCIARCMASDGDPHAREAMYREFRPGPRHGHSIGYDFLRLDGMAGFLFAAEKIGELMARGGDVDEGYLLSSAIEELGEQSVLDALEASESPGLLTYRAVAVPRHLNPPKRPKPSLVYGPEIDGLGSAQVFLWSRNAPEAEIQRAAIGLLGAREPRVQAQHLRIFCQRPFPLDPRIVLEFARSEDFDVRFQASRALGKVACPGARKLASESVQLRSDVRENAIGMLNANFEPGDHEVALNWFEAEEDPDTLHRYVMDLRDLWERRPLPNGEIAMLRQLFERGPCSWCREFIVRRLIELDGLTEQMRAECRFDASDEVRELMAA